MARMSLQTAFDQTRQWLESNDLDRAIGMAQHILQSYPQSIDAYQALGEAYLAAHQYDRACEAFESVLRFDPEHIPAHVGLGMTCERLGRLDRAVTAFERALEIKPDMPELRSQLLRLYTEAWGSEYAHLRLSRAGLARLYAKGHMLPQAISEFRQVIGDQPERLDAQVALAEALWRDEQEEEAADLCRDILATHPEALKANLILGYLTLAAGNPDGEQYWRAAAAMDPYQTTARSLFDTMPPVQLPEPMVPEWDEEAWLRQREVEQVEQLSPTRPMEAAVPVAAVLEPPPPPPPVYADSDDFLASLLAVDTAPPVVSQPVDGTEIEISADTRPFTLEELGLSDEEIAGLGVPAFAESLPAEPVPPSGEPVAEMPPAAPAEEVLDLGAMQPFTLEELGLSDAEIASLESIEAPPPAAPAEEALDLGAMRPFTLEELGLSEAEIASLESIEAPVPPDTAIEDIDIAMQPFSLDDLDLEGVGRAPGAGFDLGTDFGELPPDLQPFSMEELETGGMAERAEIGELPPSLQPFSLDEPPAPPQRPRMSGLAPEEAIESPIEEEEPLPPRGFSWQQPAQRAEPRFLEPMRPAAPAESGTIFSKLQQRREGVPLPPEEVSSPSITPDEHLGLFSLDDVPLRGDEEPELAAEMTGPGAPIAETAQGAVLEPFSPADLGPGEELAAPDLGELAPTMGETPPAGTPGPIPHAAVEIESIEAGLASGEIQPFSFADLGLSEEEIAALGLSVSAEAPVVSEAVAPPVAEAPVVSEAVAPPVAQAPEIESIEAGLASGEIQPFSFADLGLSEEEIAALGLGDMSPPVREAEPEMSSEAAGTFALEPGDLEAASMAPEQQAGEEEGLALGDLQPFSLTDLGLSAEELAELDLVGAFEEEVEEYDESRLGITEEELAALGTGGDVEWGEELGTFTAPVVAETPETMVEAGSGDAVVNQLIALGRERGYVDIADIIAAVADPEAEAARIDEIGRNLHAAHIQIRDGDEIIDLEAEYAEELPSGEAEIGVEPVPEALVAEEEVMRPFSLEELGLTSDEIDMLAAAAGAAEEPEQAPMEEPAVLTPFSLEELGLSADEIAMLDLGGMAPAAPAEAERESFALPELEPVAEAPAEEAPPPVEPPVIKRAAPPPPQVPVPAPRVPSGPPPVAEAAPSVPAHGEPEPMSGNPELDEYLRMLEAEPHNHVLRLSIARVGGQAGMPELAVRHYRDLIKRNVMLDEIVEDLSDLIADVEDTSVLRQLHRTLGDAYSRQGRFRDAMREYSWIAGRG